MKERRALSGELKRLVNETGTLIYQPKRDVNVKGALIGQLQEKVKGQMFECHKSSYWN